MDRRQGPGVFYCRQGLTDVHRFDAGHGHDVTGSGLRNLDPAQALEPVKPGDFGGHHLAVEAAEGYVLSLGEAAVEDPAHGQAAHVIIVAQGGNQELKGAVGLVGGGGHGTQDLLEERGEGGVLAVGTGAAYALAGIAVVDRELQLLLRGIEIDEEIVDLVQDL